MSFYIKKQTQRKKTQKREREINLKEAVLKSKTHNFILIVNIFFCLRRKEV